MNRVSVSPDMIRWACERAGHDPAHFAKSIPQLTKWIAGEIQPTLNQLENLANRTHTPLGYLFLPEPPDERLPVSDYRTLTGTAPKRPSPELLDTLYTMLRRQDWLRDWLIEDGEEPLGFVNSAQLSDDPIAVAAAIRIELGLESSWAAQMRSWQQALRRLRTLIEKRRVMAVVNGVVGNSTGRKLNVDEFRGFALVDPYAPLIFVNGADAKSAQIFTLAHELAHIWLGAGGLSGFEALNPIGSDVETWCNRVAAEFLVPEKQLKNQWIEFKDDPQRFELLARVFKVSPIVTARRALDLTLVEHDTFKEFYHNYVNREFRNAKKASGGSFYNNQNTRVGKMFATRVIRAAKEGRIGYTNAYALTGMGDGPLTKYAKLIGVSFP